MTLPTTNMGEIKSVKVDNWGVFFLQKLQNFFNKTDYCDLTLQFRDNSQLKVHRLVLSACTDYFNVLEQTCEVVDDAIIMPNGLQADVVVPIVNFMYTGTLEFELKMYNRLLRTAKDMNMTVLLKLLEAHRRTMEMHPQKTQMPTSPKARRKPVTQTAANIPVNIGGRSLIQTNQGKRLVVGSNQNTNVSQRGIPPGNTFSRISTTGPLPVKQQIGSTTFTRIKQENDQETNTPTQGGYTLLKQSPQQQQFQQRQATPTSPFEQLRKGYNNNKRPAVSTFISPPAKKPNLEDVKEFAEQQRMRKQIAAEYGDDGDYDASNIMDDDNIHNDDDDDDMAGQTQAPQTSVTSASAGVQTSTQQQQQQQSEDPPGTTTIIVKHEGPDKPPTIVVKDNSNSKMNHAKIISEVLRQYPHLVRSNKNIKLKIMPNAGGQTQKIIVKKETTDGEKSPSTTPAVNKLPTMLPTKVDNQPLKSVATNIQANKSKQIQQAQSATKTNTATQSMSNKQQAATTAGASTTTPVQPQKRRIDSKTMHSLIALGAENTTGPWLCLRCGRNGHPISIPSYRGFRRHLINTHKETIDPALCEHCGWRSASKRELHFHMQMEHKVKTNLYIFPECELCSQMCIDSDGLNQHLINSHPDENKQQCIYCNKIFPEELQLYTHMKTFHKKQALEDGIIDYSDDENNTDTLAMPTAEEFEQEMQGRDESDQQQPEKKIKILSDISLPINNSIIKTDSFSTENLNIPESANSAASEEYLHDHDHTETKFVAADGSEVILTDEQRKEILSQLNQEHEGSTGVVMVLNEDQQYVGGETQSEQGVISHDETSQATTATNEEHEQEDDHQDDQIYNELKTQTSQMEEDSASQTASAAEVEATNDEPDQEEHEHDPEEDPEPEHEPQPGHMDESKESIDNLEWAENLISEHDLADEVSQTTADTTESIKPAETQEESKDDKSQDEISKKLKELTGDWSEDDDEDLPEEEPMLESQPEKEVKEVDKEKETISMEDVEMAEPKEETEKIEKEVIAEQEENKDEKEEQHELTSFEAEDDKQETKENEEKIELPEQENDNIEADDIDLALESLHKENNDDGLKEEMLNKEADKEVTKDIEGKKESEIKEITEETENITQEPEEKVVNIPKEVETPMDTEIELSEKSPSVEELTKIAEAESSVMDVDEEAKKDLIDSLLKEQPESADEETASETITPAIKGEIYTKDESKTTVEQESSSIVDLKDAESPTDDEFLDIPPEKEVSNKDDEPLASTSSTTEAVEESSTVAAADSAISSEDRVKSLISEWGDDDEDEDNDTDLTANL